MGIPKYGTNTSLIIIICAILQGVHSMRHSLKINQMSERFYGLTDHGYH
jgi:hypothetical protein